MVEVVAGGLRRAQPATANTLAVQVIESYGQVKVTKKETGKPLPKVYVKCYAKKSDGSVIFHKDGYTDLRGRFDYAGVNTGQEGIERFSLLVFSDSDGAVVREAAPPK